MRVLVPLGIVYPAAFAALALLATQGAPVAALIACSALAGATLPAARCLHARDLAQPAARPQGLRDTAYALEAWLQEVFFVFGPLLAAAIAVVATPWAAVVTAPRPDGGRHPLVRAHAGGARHRAAPPGRSRARARSARRPFAP